jgi:hypothetical protein
MKKPTPQLYCPRCMSSQFKGNSSKNCPDCKKLNLKNYTTAVITKIQDSTYQEIKKDLKSGKK